MEIDERLRPLFGSPDQPLHGTIAVAVQSPITGAIHGAARFPSCVLDAVAPSWGREQASSRRCQGKNARRFSVGGCPFPICAGADLAWRKRRRGRCGRTLRHADDRPLHGPVLWRDVGCRRQCRPSRRAVPLGRRRNGVHRARLFVARFAGVVIVAAGARDRARSAGVRADAGWIGEDQNVAMTHGALRTRSDAFRAPHASWRGHRAERPIRRAARNGGVLHAWRVRKNARRRRRNGRCRRRKEEKEIIIVSSECAAPPCARTRASEDDP